MNNRKNMVDERFELASVIFRFAGNWEYNIGYSNLDNIEYPFSDEDYKEYASYNTDGTNDYQREVAETFKKFAQHEAVKYAKELKNLQLGFDAVFNFAVHTEKKDGEFVFIKDTALLFDGRWNDGRAEKFLPLFNKFYTDTNYAEFYNSHIPYFEKITQKFVDEYYQYVNFEWFSKYVDTFNLRCILSPSNSVCNYAATVNNKIVYCLVRVKTPGAMIHEYCHSFGNLLAEKWYNENPEFKKWCDDSVDLEKNPASNHGWVMANEYVTNAYDILYRCQNTGYETIDDKSYRQNEIAPILMLKDFKNGFTYIGEIFKMVLTLENDTRL
jgi:hypothetical protein